MKNCMIKTISITLILIAAILIMPANTVHAANYDDLVAPCFDNVSNYTDTLNISGTSGSAKSVVMAKSGTTNISITIDVYVRQGSSWVYVGGDSDESASRYFTFTYNFTAVEGNYYRADYTIVVTRNGVDETITESKYK